MALWRASASDSLTRAASALPMNAVKKNVIPRNPAWV